MIAPCVAIAALAHPMQYRLEQHGGGLGVLLDEDVILTEKNAPDGRERWIAERSRRDRNWCGAKSRDGKCQAIDITTHDRADSERCFGLQVTVQGFEDLRSDRVPRPRLTVSDSLLVTLTSKWSPDVHRAENTLSEYVGPLVSWWQRLDEDKHCWADQAPDVDGQPVRSQLTQP
jgi:hypothetical protein